MREGELARVSSRWGAIVARVAHSGGIARGAAFVPIHWNGQTASDARVGAVVNPEVAPVSGEPEFKHAPVRIEPFGVAWHGFLLTREELDLERIANWTRVRGAGFLRYELGGREAVSPDRATLSAGRAPAQGLDPGPTVCRCFGVGRNTICKAIVEHGLNDAAGVTARVKAGGNCGSCLPEIRELLAAR